MISPNEVLVPVNINKTFIDLNVESSIQYDWTISQIHDFLYSTFLEGSERAVLDHFRPQGDTEAERMRYITNARTTYKRVLDNGHLSNIAMYINIKEFHIPSKNSRVFLYSLCGEVAENIRTPSILMVTKANNVFTIHKNSTLRGLFEAMFYTQGRDGMLATIGNMETSNRIFAIGKMIRDNGFDFNIECIRRNVASDMFLETVSALSLVNNIIGIDTNDFLVDFTITGNLPITFKFRDRYNEKFERFEIDVNSIANLLRIYEGNFE